MVGIMKRQRIAVEVEVHRGDTLSQAERLRSQRLKHSQTLHCFQCKFSTAPCAQASLLFL
jgi:hypothetical protein